MRVRALPAVAAWVVVTATAAAARAQGYVVETATGRLERRPAAGAAEVAVTSRPGGAASARIALPFAFRHYGRRCTDAVVSAHGWLLPGAAEGFADAASPRAAHGQDPATGAFPYGAGGASADGVVAPLWTTFAAVADGTDGAGRVWTWTVGDAPRRRFVVSWERVSAGSLGRATVQAHLHESTHAVVFAYAFEPVTGGHAPATRWVCGIDEPGGARFTAPLAPTADNAGPPPGDFVLTPRCAVLNAPEAPQRGEDATWRLSRNEALRGPDGALSCPYVGAGTCWFFVADRATRGDPARLRALRDEDRAAFGGAGDATRWVRQVLDGKLTLVPADGGATRRVWFRVIEFFTLDDRGLAGRDDHVWNVRILLSLAFPAGDPRGDIESYAAWRAEASASLAVGKLFDARTASDAGRQFDSGRVGEDVNWCARFRVGRRGPMPEDDCPTDGWTRFPMKDRDEVIVQHADRRDVRWVADPNYVAGGYEYVVRSAAFPDGWVARRRLPPGTLVVEAFDHDPDDGTR